MLQTLPRGIQEIIKEEKIYIKFLTLFSIDWFLIQKIIWINKNNHFYRKRFTICHELWHYINWDSYDLPWVPYWKNESEKKADDFAIKFLLPEKDLLEEYNRNEWDLCILEKIFWVEKEIIYKKLCCILVK